MWKWGLNGNSCSGITIDSEESVKETANHMVCISLHRWQHSFLHFASAIISLPHLNTPSPHPPLGSDFTYWTFWSPRWSFSVALSALCLGSFWEGATANLLPVPNTFSLTVNSCVCCVARTQSRRTWRGGAREGWLRRCPLGSAAAECARVFRITLVFSVVFQLS